MIVGTGAAPELDETPDRNAAPDGTVAVWPIRRDRSDGNWQVGPTALMQHVEEGRVRIGGSPEKGFVLYYIARGEYEKVLRGDYPVLGKNPDGSLDIGGAETEENLVLPGTQWRIPSHDATQYGSRLLQKFLPSNAFPFPKSLYAVQDTMRFFLEDKPDALILDFFAGSGTTLHATCLLNATDNGARRCYLVTNNEVNEDRARQLAADGLFPGDREYECHGIFQAATRPRIEAAILGERLGQPIEGSYLDGRKIAQGFEENVEFAHLEHLNPELIEIGVGFGTLGPFIWLAAGAKDDLPEALPMDEPFFVAEQGGYAVLLDDSAIREFVEVVAEKEAVEQIYIVTNFDDTFAAITSSLSSRETTMLPRDYLRRFTDQTGDRR